MDSSYVIAQIGTTTSDISTALSGSLPLILTVVAALIALGFLIWVIYSWIGDNSFSLGGYCLHNLPYKGYHRFRSKKWNAEHIE